ncbi:MAG: LPS export ABC transporter periplasmic protein LptC [Proteobacteria bacterium]|nr:LPS export ABC transporter periplasmic protein LptC [Candidatus Enterousia scatequi]
MQTDTRNFLILNKHKRLTRLRQFFFTGWGLVMIASLIAGALFTKQILWTPISAINMTDIVSNQFKMSNASFSGTDKNGEPFEIHALSGRQEYTNPNLVLLSKVSGKTVRIDNNKKITDNITANSARYDRDTKTITLFGHVRVDSSNGDKILTDEMVIQL